MIFVVVGTHEEQFNRLIEAVDDLNTSQHRIVQFGYSDYSLKNCEGHQFLDFEEVELHMQGADVVITHSGTGSVMLALSLGKIPIVAPRYQHFREHVDDHQVQLAESLEAEGRIIPFYEGDDLSQRIEQALCCNSGVRKIEPDPRLVADLRAIIDSV